MTNPASNTRDCFREFVGQRCIGVLFDALPDGRQDLSAGTKTLVFEDGRGLTIASNGSYWIDNAATVIHAVRRREIELGTIQREIVELVALAGVHPRAEATS